jgi:hypothetical protein
MRGIGLSELLLLLVLGAMCIGFPVLIILVVVGTSRRQGKMGINLKAVVCPTCQAPAPVLRKPANLKQMLWGGWTCAQCGTELDKWGRAVSSPHTPT